VPSPAYDTPILSIGDITVTRTSVIVPTGRYPLRDTNWSVHDAVVVTQAIPAYAIVLAVVFAVFCLIGLLFLLIKEPRFSGLVSVTVIGKDLYHTTQLPAGHGISAYVASQVNQARMLATAA
jgi:hypothetical protein